MVKCRLRQTQGVSRNKVGAISPIIDWISFSGAQPLDMAVYGVFLRHVKILLY